MRGSAVDLANWLYVLDLCGYLQRTSCPVTCSRNKTKNFYEWRDFVVKSSLMQLGGIHGKSKEKHLHIIAQLKNLSIHTRKISSHHRAIWYTRHVCRILSPACPNLAKCYIQAWLLNEYRKCTSTAVFLALDSDLISRSPPPPRYTALRPWLPRRCVGCHRRPSEPASQPVPGSVAEIFESYCHRDPAFHSCLRNVRGHMFYAAAEFNGQRFKCQTLDSDDFKSRNFIGQYARSIIRRSAAKGDGI